MGMESATETKIRLLIDDLAVLTDDEVVLELKGLPQHVRQHFAAGVLGARYELAKL